jgi:DNA-binding LacI/PurR family transcriptional regulator
MPLSLKNPKVTLADVAARAGMSQATASRALRGLNVHKKYRGKAQAAAAELGYVLNESARALRSVRTMTVGMVYHDLTSMLGMELLRAMAAGLDEIGYSLFVSTAQGKSDHFDQLVHRLLQRRVDALICVHGDGEGAPLAGYAAADIPVMALITKRGGYAGLPMISPTAAGASKACAARLKQLGHENTALLTLKMPSPANDFVSAAKGKKLKVEQRIVERDSFDAKALLRELMDKSPRPTAIVALQAEAAKILEAAKAMKIRVPADLSVVAIRDRSQTVAPGPVALSTIHLNPTDMGLLASQVLKEWLVEGVALEHDQAVEIGSWIERETTGPAP